MSEDGWKIGKGKKLFGKNFFPFSHTSIFFIKTFMWKISDFGCISVKIFNKIITLFFCAFLLTGCNSVSTYNFIVSRTVTKSVVPELAICDELHDNAIVIIFTSNKNKSFFSLQNTKNKDEYAEGFVDKKSFAALILPAGDYLIQNKMLKAEKNKCYFFLIESMPTTISPKEFFSENHEKLYLSKEVKTSMNIRSAAEYFSDKVNKIDIFRHYAPVIAEVLIIAGMGIYCIVGIPIIILYVLGVSVILLTATFFDEEDSENENISQNLDEKTPMDVPAEELLIDKIEFSFD